MRSARSIVSVLTLIAVALGPAAVGLMPCLCHAAETKASCCHEKAAAPKSCGSKNHKSAADLRTPVECAYCCSLQDSAPIPLTQAGNIKFSVESVESPTAVAPVRTPIPTDCAFCRVSDDPCSLSGPRLLALHCTWLK